MAQLEASSALDFDTVTYDGQRPVDPAANQNESDEVVESDDDEAEASEHTPETNAILTKSSKVRIVFGFASDTPACDCGDNSSMQLPCRHIFYARKVNNLQLFKPTMVDSRWLPGQPADVESGEIQYW